MTMAVAGDAVLRTGFVSPKFLYAFAVALALAACAAPPVPPAEPPGPLRLAQTEFTALPGWSDGGHAAALTAFRRSCERFAEMAPDQPLTGTGYGGSVGDWLPTCAAAAEIGQSDDAARHYFEVAFLPYRVFEGTSTDGFFTGYYEPELNGSLLRQGSYQTPLFGPPPDLVSVDLGLFRESLAGQRIAGRLEGNRLIPYPARAEIARNGVPGAEPLLYVDDPADAFFLQIQGSGRIRLEDGTVLRASYAGQNGHPYTAIGAVLINRGELAREEVSMQSIRAWLDAHPDEAQELFDQNASYVFFAVQPLGDPALGASGTLGAPLTAAASIAVDDAFHPLGAPIWLETAVAAAGSETPFHRLLVAQDTGGAINGPLRGDIYWGVGAEAGEIAGRMRSMGRLAILLPRSIAARIGPSYAEGGAQ